MTTGSRSQGGLQGGAWANFITFSVAPQRADVEVSFIATTIHLAKEGVVCLLRIEFDPGIEFES